ncbi:Hypothetical predicted protein [Paramuricea clavata]|uniref:Uncharacterized protein n=1 Tax=Paramuricea clavata TaxID=317549 RepID=A0A6S7HKR9_PARCT|nr:Hypothetical predicted protein [Paramuricea clavata]
MVRPSETTRVSKAANQDVEKAKSVHAKTRRLEICRDEPTDGRVSREGRCERNGTKI